MTKRTSAVVCALTLGLGAFGCSSSGDSGPDPEPTTTLPQVITAVASDGFERPSDAVSSHDGATFYFTGIRPGADGEVSQSAVFRVPSTGGTATPLHAGAPLGNPTGLVMSCDNATLYVADLGQAIDDEAEVAAPADGERPADAGALFMLTVETGAISALPADGIARPSGLALSEDCATLYVTGWTAAGEPALFTLGLEGGTARTVLAGAPLVSPTGVHVDKDGVAWVMDHLADGEQGAGVLFAVDSAGTATAVISDIQMGTPGGVSLDSTGTTAFMPTRNADGEGQLTAVTLATGEVQQVAAPMMRDPAGIRTARDAPVFAVVDSESHTIYAAR